MLALSAFLVGNGDIEARPLDLESILAEIRNLRLQLERSVASNDLLHQKLDRFNADSRCNADPDCRENDGLSKTASGKPPGIVIFQHYHALVHCDQLLHLTYESVQQFLLLLLLF
jgi:hypothetical protein